MKSPWDTLTLFKKERELHRAMAQLDDCYQELLNLLQENVVVSTIDGQIIFVNKGCCDLLDVEPEYLIGMNVGKVVQPKSVIDNASQLSALPEAHSLIAHFSSKEPYQAIGRFEELVDVDVLYKPVQYNGQMINLIFFSDPNRQPKS